MIEPLQAPLYWIKALFTRAFLYDQARPVELLSVLAMSGWAQLLLTSPEILNREGYRGFAALNGASWTVIMAAVAAIQLVVMFKPVGRVWQEMRFGAMAMSSGLWTVIASNFWISGISSTANLTYSSIAFVTALTGVYLGWKIQTSSNN